MKIANALHSAVPWRVHTLLPDFELLDVWEIDSSAPWSFERFYSIIAESEPAPKNVLVAGLFKLREILGRIFGWDHLPEPRPIPGCAETSVVARLSPEDHARSSVPPGTIKSIALEDLTIVYHFEDEALIEISNATIHALLHFSWAKTGKPRLAVYIKSRGFLSRVYMALIEPFRNFIVYPAWTKNIAAQLRYAEP